MTKPKGEGFEYGVPPVNAKFGYSKLLLYPIPLTWDFIRVRQFIKTHCESEDLRKSSLFLYKEQKDSDRIWVQFDTEALCQLAYSKLQGIELNGKSVTVEFDKRVNRQNINFNKPPNMNMQNNFNCNNDYGMGNFTPTPQNDVGPAYQETYGLSVGFLTSLGIQPPMRNKVFVANLVPTVTERELQNVMSLAGRVTNVTMLRNSGSARGQAAVEFDHPVEAVQAISMLNNQEFYGRSMVVRMYRQEPKLPLPVGLSGVGMGLGPNGEPMKAIGTTLEILPLKHRLERAIKRLSGETVPDDNYVAPYGADVADNFNPNFGMPPFCMPNGPMPPFMPFPPDQMNGPFMPGPMGMGPNMMPGPMGMPGPNMPMPGPNMPMPGPNMPMAGPNMPMAGPNMPMPGPSMPMPGPNMPMPGPNMPMAKPNMPMAGPNMPIASPNMPIAGPNLPMAGTNMPIAGPNVPMAGTNMPVAGTNMPASATISKPATVTPKTPVKTPKAKTPVSSPPEDKDIPGLSEVTLPKSPPPLPKSPLPSKSKKITLSIKSEKCLRGKQDSPEPKADVKKEDEITKTKRKEKYKEELPVSKKSRSRNGRSESSSPEREPEREKSKGNTELTDNLLQLFQGDAKKKPSLDALQGFMEQVINLSKTMSVLRDVVPSKSDRSPPKRGRRGPSESPDRDSDYDRRKDKRTDVESSTKISRTISALREKEPMLPVNESPQRVQHSEWSPDSNGSREYDAPRKLTKWDLESIELPPGKPKDKSTITRESEWTARVPPRSPDHDPRPTDKRTYVATMPSEPELSRGPKARKTEPLPVITVSDMLTFTNLPPTVSVKALSSKMRQVGELKFAELTGAGRAVVRFQRVQDAERCIKLFHRSKVDGQIIEVTPY